MGRSSQLLYHELIEYGLSAEAVGTKQIFGFVFLVSAATYCIYGLPKEPPVTKTIFSCAIEIFTTEGKQLVVNNNLNPKIIKEKSTRIGLQNIESKYKLMNQDGFQVVNGEKYFMVVLPLFWKQPKKV